MFKSLTRWVAASILSCAFMGSANAVLVTVEYSGIVDYAVDSLTLNDLGLVGTDFSGSLAYETQYTGSSGTYFDVVTAANITFGGTTYVFDLVNAVSADIAVSNTNSNDSMLVAIATAALDGMAINVADGTGDTFSGQNDSLPEDLFSFDTLDLLASFIIFEGFGIIMEGTVTSFAAVTAVPEPSMLALLGLGLLGIALGRRKLAA